MKYALRTTLFALLAAFAAAAGAQQDISGTWVGTLAPAPDTNLDIHFILTGDGQGGYTAVVTSPDTGAIKDVTASSVRFEGNRLTIGVDELSGEYDGVLEDGGFNGEWRQEGTALALRLAPYEAPVLSQADIELLSGSWVGKLEAPGATVTLVYRFETGAEGNLIGFLDSVDEGAYGIPLSDIELVDGALAFKIPQARVDFTASVSGDTMEGTWKQVTAELPLTMTRGEYVPPASELSDEAKRQLAGSWIGTVDPPNSDPVAMVARFETNADGRFVGAFDSPEQGRSGMPITEISVADGELSFRVPAAGAQYTASFDGEQLDGTFARGPNTLALTLRPGTYTPTVKPLELSADALERLAGTWRGSLRQTAIVVRFETTEDDMPVGSLTVPAQGLSGVAVTAASLADGEVTFSIGALGMQYTAALDGETMSGDWRLGPGNVLPVTLTRE